MGSCALHDRLEPAEPHPDQFLNTGLSIRPFVDHREPLRLVWAQRQNDPSSGFDLIEDRRRQSLGGGRQQGSIVGRVLAPATRPVSDADGDIRAAELAQVRFGLACQLLHDFDTPHPTGKLGQDRGLIAQPGSDLEDALMRLGAEEVGHERDYEGLRDRLIEADRQRRVLVSERARKEGTKRCRGTLRIAASTRSSRAALPSSSLARSTWIPMTSTMCRRRIAKCASLIGFMACPTLMLVLVRSTRWCRRDLCWNLIGGLRSDE